MFGFLKGIQDNKELESIKAKIDSNVANNYKDAAQEALKLYEKRLAELVAEGKLHEKQKARYEAYLLDYRAKMKEFTHKDQKPYWT